MGLRWGRDPLTATQLHDLPLDAHLVVDDVDIAAAQPEQVTEAQSSEPCDEHQGAVALLDGAGEADHDLGVDERSLGGPLHACDHGSCTG